MIRSFKYPLRPTKAQASTLTAWLGVCCDVYNAALQERRDAWRIARVSVTFFGQTAQLTQARAADPDLAAVPADIQRSTIRRVEFAFQAFFRRCKSGQTPGYPRFKSRRRFDSFAFPVPKIIGNRVWVPNAAVDVIGTGKFRKDREP